MKLYIWTNQTNVACAHVDEYMFQNHKHSASICFIWLPSYDNMHQNQAYTTQIMLQKHLSRFLTNILKKILPSLQRWPVEEAQKATSHPSWYSSKQQVLFLPPPLFLWPFSGLGGLTQTTISAKLTRFPRNRYHIPRGHSGSLRFWWCHLWKLSNELCAYERLLGESERMGWFCGVNRNLVWMRCERVLKPQPWLCTEREREVSYILISCLLKLWMDYGRCGSCRTLGYFFSLGLLGLINDVVFMVYISL